MSSPNLPPNLRPLASRRRGRIVAAFVAGAIAIALPACQLSWSVGKTHGVIVEPAAVRASVGVWRMPSRLLYSVYESNGINPVQDLLCSAGKFPTLKVSVSRFSVSSSVLKSKWCGYVYGNDADVRGALIDAQRGKADDCLALTLISRGAYIKNWTHKSSGCKTGSLG
jgi:hypothetical protein